MDHETMDAKASSVSDRREYDFLASQIEMGVFCIYGYFELPVPLKSPKGVQGCGLI